MKQFKRIYIEITNFCNLNCSFCAKSTRNKLFMSKDNFERIIEQISNYTDYVYLHVLGEPLLHPELDEILSICEKFNLNVNITTNGTLLLNKLEILKKHKVRQFNISLHCENNLDKDKYFNDIFCACDELSKNSYISFRNWRNNDEIITNAILKKYGVSIENKTKQTIKENIFFSIEDAFIWQGEENDLTGKCYGFKNMCAILSNGDVTACCIDYDASINLGNVFETSFEQIVNSKKFLTLKMGIEANKFLCPTCQKCNFKTRFK